MTSRSGLSLLAEVLEALNIKQQADALFPAPGSNCSYDNSTIVNTFVLMLNEGARCLEDVYHLHTEAELLKLLGIQELPGLSIETQYETDKYIYRVIATNIEGLDDSQIVHEYNQRGECAENRIKELKSDFSAGRLPCSDFGANALYVSLCSLAYNVFALLRCGLSTEFRFARAPTLRVRLFGLAAKVVRHG